jgi:hypothetical protein
MDVCILFCKYVSVVWECYFLGSRSNNKSDQEREEGIGEEGICGGRIGEKQREIREGFGFAVFRRFSPYCTYTVLKVHKHEIF